MEAALRSAGISAAEIDYINAHGTATSFNDAAEGKAIAELFAEAPISSTKAMMGHSLGAAGAIEAVISLLALRDQFLPPNINFRQGDADLALEYCREQIAAARNLRTVLSNSFGFGGTNASVILRRRMSLRDWRHGLGDAAWPRRWRSLAAFAGGRKGHGRIDRGPQPGSSFRVFRVPPAATASMPTHPRLRRSSAISRFAVVAGLDALADAGIKLDSESAKRTAIIFAVSNGGVVYTKRFYHDIVATGAQAASPLLFPETVFNAPASHLAAILGITGASYTLVGDGAVGLLALKMAEDLMLDPALDRCLVVGAEESDPLLCDAYHRWRLRMTLSEGAGALLVDRRGEISIDAIDAGSNFVRQMDAAKCVDEIFARLKASDSDLIVASANGTFIDRAESTAIARHCQRAPVYAPKTALGESVGASSIWQVICAAQALKTRAIPGLKNHRANRAVVSACGLNQQVAGLTLAAAS